MMSLLPVMLARSVLLIVMSQDEPQKLVPSPIFPPSK